MNRAALVIATSLFGLGANASYFQTYCSNGEAATKITKGHSENSISVTEKKWESGEAMEIVREYNFTEVNMVETERQVLEASQDSSCKEGDQTGIGYWKTVSTMKISLTKVNGTNFPEHTVGISQDGKTVQAHVICEESGNSMVRCPTR